MKLNKKLLKKLRYAKVQILVAHSITYGNASSVEPFKASKFLNIIGKELDQLALELSVFITAGDYQEDKFNDYSFEFEKIPSLAILKSMHEDGILGKEVIS